MIMTIVQHYKITFEGDTHCLVTVNINDYVGMPTEQDFKKIIDVMVKRQEKIYQKTAGLVTSITKKDLEEFKKKGYPFMSMSAEHTS